MQTNCNASSPVQDSGTTTFLEKRKEASRVENAGEFVYKKLCIVLQSAEKINIYDFFYNKTSSEEIDRLLVETRDSLLLASTHRGRRRNVGSA